MAYVGLGPMMPTHGLSRGAVSLQVNMQDSSLSLIVSAIAVNLMFEFCSINH